MKAIIFARVSDKKQDSNEAQVNRISEYVKFKNLTIWKTYEIEESSSQGDREKFQEVVKEIKKSKESVALIVDTVDRLQRSFRESVVLDDLRKTGKLEIHFYRENLIININSNSADLLRWDMAVMFARSYILQLSDNVKRKLELKRKNGEWLGKAPIGYKNIGEEKNKRDVIPDPKNAHLIRKLFEFYATGNFSLEKLLMMMTVEGLKTIDGKPLARSMIDHILNNPFYYGEMRTGGKLYPHKYTPLVSKALFDKCQEIKRNWNKKPFQYAAKPFALRGLMRCGNCGCTMSPELKKQKYVYYSCTNAKGTCKREYVPEKLLLKPIIDVLSDLSTIPQGNIDEVVEGVKKANKSKDSYHKHSISVLRQEYDTIQTRLRRLTDLYVDGSLSQDMYEEKLKQYKDQQRDINLQLDDHTNADENYYETASIVLSLAKEALSIFNSSEAPGKRVILNFLLQNCAVREKELMFTIRSPFNWIHEAAVTKSWLPLQDRFRTTNWAFMIDEIEVLKKTGVSCLVF